MNDREERDEHNAAANANANAAAAAIPDIPAAEEQDPVLGSLLEELHAIAGHDGYDGDNAVDLEKARNVLEATAGDVPLAAQLYWDDFLATQAQLQRQRRADPAPARPAVAAAAPPDRYRAADRLEEEEDVGGGERPGRRRAAAAAAAANNGNAPAAMEMEVNELGEDHDEDDPEDEVMVDVAVAVAIQPVLEFVDDDDFPNHRGGAGGGAGGGHRIRRSLERDFERQRDEDDDDDDENDDVGEEQPPVVAVDRGRAAEDIERVIVRARRRLEDQIDNGGEPQLDNPAAAVAAPDPPGQAQPEAAQPEGGESVSVSDDEAVGVWRMVGGMKARLEEKRNANRAQDEGDSAGRKRRRMPGADKSAPAANKETEKAKAPLPGNDKGGYLSDNDWLWESMVSRSSIPLCSPVDLLWGLPPTNTTSAANNAEDPEAEGNVIADDEKEEEDDSSSSNRSGIPRTWLNAGFHLSECTSGITLKPPSEDDIAYFAWRQQTTGNGNSRNAIPSPYHCRALTALLSVVTGLLYTGASIQTKEVTCSTARKSFVELTPTERRREFEVRLADALSSLLFIAAKASVERKKIALKTLRMSKEPADKRKWQKLEGKLRLCPTCSWEQDPTTGEIRLPEGCDADRNIQIATSYTNIEDLRAYVVSNMSSFTSSGGCALFLETILRIHGRGAVRRMADNARVQAKLPAQASKSLIDCTCEERHKKEMEDNPPSMKVKRGMNSMSDTTPPGHECIATELLSLILTGSVHSDFKGWSTRPLGIGLLSNKAGEVGRPLSRPDKPVWILHGPTCYSVMWLNGSKDQAESFSKTDKAGTVAELTHWNCWYDKRNKTHLRLILGRSEWTPPSFSSDDMLEGPLHPHKAIAALISRRHRDHLNAAEEREVPGSHDQDLVFSEQELDRITVNPEDQKFYPEKYRMWRYDMGQDAGNLNQKKRAERWTPFHRLDKREKLAVETKLGPKIKTILWNRWPRATIDKFTPDESPPIV